jgi:hypothetical protein
LVVRGHSNIRIVDVTVGAAAVMFLAQGSAWAFVSVPAPEAGGMAGLAIVGTLIAAKWWRRK